MVETNRPGAQGDSGLETDGGCSQKPLAPRSSVGGGTRMSVTWVPGTAVVTWRSHGENPLSCVLVKCAPLSVMLYADTCSSHNAGRQGGPGREAEKRSGVWREARGRGPREDPGGSSAGHQAGEEAAGEPRTRWSTVSSTGRDPGTPPTQARARSPRGPAARTPSLITP